MQRSMETEQQVYIDNSEANTHRWRDDCNSVFSCKVTQSALQDQERKIPEVAKLYYVSSVRHAQKDCLSHTNYAVEGRRNGQKPWSRCNKIQSSESLV